MGVMAAKSARKPQKKRPDSDPLQYERFLEAARVAEASDDPDELTQAIKKLASGKASSKVP
jgi:hypothetical protein